MLRSSFLLILGLAAPAAADPIATGTYGELGYTLEWSHWATPAGHAGVVMSGVSYTESRGAFTNLMLSGAAASGQNLACTREVGGRCVEAVDTGPTEQELAAAQAIAERRPAALRLTAWHEGLGSDVDGVDARLGIVRAEPGVVMTTGVGAGLVRSNRRSAPIMPPEPGVPDPPDPTFDNRWIGGFVEGRTAVHERHGGHMRVLVAYDGGLMVLVHLGYEHRVGPVSLSIGADTDSYKPKRAGAYAGVGVVF